jgi:acetyl/propionyl-CoA carboxylase alpha subunit
MSNQVVPEWAIGTDFDSLLAKIIIRDQSFDDCTQKARRALREFRLAKECKVKTNIAVLTGVLEHQDWHVGTIDTLWLERNLDEILRFGKAAVENRNDAGTTTGLSQVLGRREESNSGINAIGSHISSGTLLLQPGSLFHLALSPVHSLNPSSPQETAKHVLTLNSISNNSFPEKLSGVLQSTFSPSPLAFSLSRVTSAVVGSGEGVELANPNDTRHIASPLSGKIVDIHPAFKLLSVSATIIDEDKKMVKKGETLTVMSVMKMENSVVAPFDGIIERIGKGLKIGSIIGEGMLICVLNPLRRRSRL